MIHKLFWCFFSQLSFTHTSSTIKIILQTCKSPDSSIWEFLLGPDVSVFILLSCRTLRRCFPGRWRSPINRRCFWWSSSAHSLHVLFSILLPQLIVSRGSFGRIQRQIVVEFCDWGYIKTKCILLKKISCGRKTEKARFVG